MTSARAALCVVLPLLAGCDDAAPAVRDASSTMDSGGSLDAAVSDAGASSVDAADEPLYVPPPPPSQPGRHDVEVRETRQVIPGPGLPAETRPGNSNNNLDVVRHDGRVYLAWRTAPDHFASSEARMHVVSTADERAWRFETTLTFDRDLREPRFLSFHGRLILHLARLGTNRLAFEPEGMSRTVLGTDGRWGALEPFYRPGFIPWRSKVERGRAYLVAYVGGEHIYRFDNMPLDVELLTSTDGLAWTPVNPSRPSVYRGGGSETDFALGDAGELYGVIRNEAGDETGWGSMVCTAPASALASWTCRNDPRKYDSPLMFWHDGEAYLIARRNLTETGAYDLGQRDFDRTRQTVAYQLDYRVRPKRCSLWRFDRTTSRVVFVLDLPSRGDTCFPAVIEGQTPNERVVYNYSSPVDGPEIDWAHGQIGETRVYRHVLRFTPRGG